jgi:hypothetical protein
MGVEARGNPALASSHARTASVEMKEDPPIRPTGKPWSTIPLQVLPVTGPERCSSSPIHALAALMFRMAMWHSVDTSKYYAIHPDLTRNIF